MKKKKGYTMTERGVSMDRDESYKSGKNSGSYPSHKSIEEAGHEIKKNPPAILKHTAKKFGKARAKKQKIAIMLSKARKGK